MLSFRVFLSEGGYLFLLFLVFSSCAVAAVAAALVAKWEHPARKPEQENENRLGRKASFPSLTKS